MDKPTTVNGIFRTDSGALINKNNDALLSYKRKKEQSRKMETLEKKVDEMTNDMNEIKAMLYQLIQQTKV
jgi:hypothetical protein